MEHNVKRVLKRRHLNMITLGGTIGTGLFLSSGACVAQAGPGGALLAFAAMGIMVFFLMTSLGELTTALPVSGSLEVYASKYIDESIGFAMGWMYWLSYALTVASELVAAAVIMAYWFPNVPGAVWSIAAIVILFLLNCISAKIFGEAEFWFAGIKVVVVIIFIVVGVLTIIGIMGGAPIGFHNFTVGEAPFVGGFLSVIGIFMVAGFSFMGTEMIAVAAGESENPKENIPGAIKSVFWRILLFYILTILVIGCILPYDDPNLLNMDLETIAMSPFTMVFERAGLAFAAAAMNAVILTAILSAGNSGLYSASRMLWAMGQDGKAPKCFGKTSKSGVPINAVIFTTLVACLSFLSSLWGEGTVYLLLLSAAGLTGFICWIIIAISHYRFRKGLVRQGVDLNHLSYKAMWFPFGPIFALILCIVVIIGQSLDAISNGQIVWSQMILLYSGLVIFLVLWLGYKAVHRTKVVKYEEMDLSALDKYHD